MLYFGMKGTTYIRDSADAMPHAVPRTLVPNISGVQLGRVRYLALESQNYRNIPI